MKWFNIHFNETDLVNAPDAELIHEFLLFRLKAIVTDGLVLYHPIKTPEYGMDYYISVNEANLTNFHNVLSHYNYSEIEQPTLSNLQVLSGFNSKTD